MDEAELGGGSGSGSGSSGGSSGEEDEGLRELVPEAGPKVRDSDTVPPERQALMYEGCGGLTLPVWPV